MIWKLLRQQLDDFESTDSVDDSGAPPYFATEVDVDPVRWFDELKPHAGGDAALKLLFALEQRGEESKTAANTHVGKSQHKHALKPSSCITASSRISCG